MQYYHIFSICCTFLCTISSILVCAIMTVLSAFPTSASASAELFSSIKYVYHSSLSASSEISVAVVLIVSAFCFFCFSAKISLALSAIYVLIEISIAGVLGALTPALSNKESSKLALTRTLTFSSLTKESARLTKCGAVASNRSFATCTDRDSRSLTKGCCIICTARDGVICRF